MLFSIVKDYFGDVVDVSADAEDLSFFSVEPKCPQLYGHELP
ncbi:hypothetical protein ACQ4N7_01610 [Nodosilinea sp. AN01ver1]